jgi:hypothetical protein
VLHHRNFKKTESVTSKKYESQLIVMNPKLMGWLKKMVCVQVQHKKKTIYLALGPLPRNASQWRKVHPLLNSIRELLCDGDMIFQIPYHNLAIQSCDHEAKMSRTLFKAQTRNCEQWGCPFCRFQT